MTESPLMSVRDVTIEFAKVRSLTDLVTGRKARVAKAVDGVSIDVMPQETIGLVGESGSGKTTLGRAMLGLYKPAAGTVSFKGHDIHDPDRTVQAGLRRNLQMVYQNPFSSSEPPA
ncbi:MAG: ATP-binding cassette domain-containing protein [Rhodobacteraceae bacterium]|nr:ATP-binding cassette domain-containing protein [Paracoccaceae bacterium]